MYTLFEKICAQLQLGAPLRPPTPLSGGLLHQMYSLHTPKGHYALKLLNPSVMERKTAPENFRRAEMLERRLERYSLPILPSLTFEGRKMQETDGRFYYLFPWYGGRAIRPEAITRNHCRRIGCLLAAIHGAESFPDDAFCLRTDNGTPEALPADVWADTPADPAEGICVDWDFYIRGLERQHRELSLLLAHNRTVLYESQERGRQATGKLPFHAAICHNDLDCKNVLWNGSDCRIIDLECLSMGNSYFELYETALYWSGYEQDQLHVRLLESFLCAYRQEGGLFPEGWELLYDGCCGRLEWLEYNLQRVLDESCPEAEKHIGLQEIPRTIAHAVSYRNFRDRILRCLEQFVA